MHEGMAAALAQVDGHKVTLHVMDDGVYTGTVTDVDRGVVTLERDGRPTVVVSIAHVSTLRVEQ